MTSLQSAPARSTWKKTALQALAGGVFGAGAMFLTLNLIDGPDGIRLRPDEILTLGMGVIYTMMGMFVGLGVLFPKPGAALLNVEDAEELREQRRVLGWSGFGCVLIGISALALVLATPSLAILSPGSAALLFGGCLVAMLLSSYVTWKEFDEFSLRLTRDSNTAFLVLLSLVFGIWAPLAHLGFVPMFSALTFYGGTLALYLLAVFWSVGRRGLLAPRG